MNRARIPMRLVRSILSCLALVAGGAAAFSGCRAKDDGRIVHLNGRIEAPLVDLAPKVSGRVVEVLVREGDRVKAGDVLARLDLGDTALAVERDREGVRSAQARYEDLASGSRRSEIAAAEADVARQAGRRRPRAPRARAPEHAARAQDRHRTRSGPSRRRSSSAPSPP